mmetsp:Transcript_29479/g.38057  ORF Transcript_29479/g.38057 Transcript_29479/m.38057 type:complete len:105 (+) Transcript_29479:42-356(+)
MPCSSPALRTGNGRHATPHVAEESQGSAENGFVARTPASDDDCRVVISYRISGCTLLRHSDQFLDHLVKPPTSPLRGNKLPVVTDPSPAVSEGGPSNTSPSSIM